MAEAPVRVYPSRVTTQGPPGASGGPPIDPRLARPTAPPAAAPAAPQPLEVLDPPAFGELFAAGFLGLASPGETFGGLARRPEPTPADVALALLAWGAAASAVFVAFALTKLNAGSWGVLPLAGGALGALVLAAPAGLAAGAGLHALAVLSGGQGGYWRSAQAAAVLGAVPSLVIAALWVAPHPAWMAAPILLGTWLAVCAVEKLHDAPGGQAWMVVGFVGALLAGSTVVAHDKVSLALVRLENAATVLSNNPGSHAEPARSAAGLAAPLSAPSMPSAGDAGDRLTGQPGSAGPIEADPDAAAAAASQSSLDFLRTGAAEGEEGGRSEAAQADDARMRQAQAMQQNATGLLQKLSKELTKNSSSLPPDQAAQLKSMLDKMQRSMAGGQGAPMMTPAETQKLLQQFLGAMGQQQQAAQKGAPPPPAKRRTPPPRGEAPPPAPAD